MTGMANVGNPGLSGNPATIGGYSAVNMGGTALSGMYGLMSSAIKMMDNNKKTYLTNRASYNNNTTIMNCCI